MRVNGVHYRTVWMEEGTVRLIDQRRLPFRFEIRSLASYRETAEAIRDMTVRGAGAIGVAAGYAMAQAAQRAASTTFDEELAQAAAVVRATRPTAWNLFYAVDRVLEGVRSTDGLEAKRSRAAAIAQAIAIMQDASSIGRYTSVSPREAFAVEYWPLELYKLSLAPPEAELARQVGLITGAAGGIGRAIAGRLVDAGACVMVTDLERQGAERLAQALNQRAGRTRAVGAVMDVTSERSIERAFDLLLRTFGGLDFLISNAGIAHVAAIDRLRLADWERSLNVNATGHFLVSRAAVRRLRAQQLGGSIVFIASKNVLAPGKEFGAYSAAKAAQTQLARVLAIENGEASIRVNVVNPDGVFEGSGLWKTIGASRAQTYHLRPDELPAYYRRRNLLQARVLPEDVAEAVAFFVSPRSAKTTGCILTVDGGVKEAFPR